MKNRGQKLYEKAKLLRDHAMSKDRRYWHTEIGYNYRITNLQAALGLAQLERIEAIVGKKRQIFNWYKAFLRDIEGMRLNPEKEWARNVYWMICFLLDKNFRINRDHLLRKLKETGIDTRPFFYPMSQMPMYNKGKMNHVAYETSQKGFNLPSGVNLTKEDVEWVCAKTKTILKHT